MIYESLFNGLENVNDHGAFFAYSVFFFFAGKFPSQDELIFCPLGLRRFGYRLSRYHDM